MTYKFIIDDLATFIEEIKAAKVPMPVYLIAKFSEIRTYQDDGTYYLRPGNFVIASAWLDGSILCCYTEVASVGEGYLKADEWGARCQREGLYVKPGIVPGAWPPVVEPPRVAALAC
jgi:hypothetical protein